MELATIVKFLNLEQVGSVNPVGKITGVYCSDLLSDVMAHAASGSLLVTILTHENVVAVASLLELGAVLFPGGKRPGEETLRRANENDIPLLSTKMSTFEAAGRLYQLFGCQGQKDEEDCC